MDTVIKIENLSKLYRLGEIGTGTISHDLNRWWQTKILNKEDPYTKIGQVNDRTQKAAKGEHIWALNDINLEVKQGEVLGIIGKNGAGKSTLLKLLSRVTSPTTGTIKTKGRLASLLEVGTGFHPEMTGRENIYMNGTIMGMRKWEIDQKLDEIIDFAGVAKYIDTPTKRYSSGMTVRLGFAIAAFLEPEILVVDEVLAVGDAEFQKRAIGKMKEVSKKNGRTVLFVSHNMAAVKALCSRGILIDNGLLKIKDTVENTIEKYLSETIYSTKYKRTGGSDVYFKSLQIINSEKREALSFCTLDNVTFKLVYNSEIRIKNVSVAVCFNNVNGVRITSLWSTVNNSYFIFEKGRNEIEINVSEIKLIPGTYELIIYSEANGQLIERIDNYRHIVVGPSNKINNLIIEQGVYVERFTEKLL